MCKRHLKRDISHVTRKDLPVATTIVIASIRSIPGREVPWWRAIVRPAMTVHVGIWWGRIVPTISILITTRTGRRRVVVNWSTSPWRRAIISTTVIIVASTGRASVTVTIAAGTVATRRSTSIIVICVWTTETWRSRAVSIITRYLRLGLDHISIRLNNDEDILTSAVQVTRAPLNSRPSSFSTAVLRSAAVSNSTKLQTGQYQVNNQSSGNLPFAITIAASLGINHIKAGLTGKVF